MRYITRANKGRYLYIKRQLIFEIVVTIVMFAMALGIFFIGLSTLGTKKSLWSVISVLALLPACKSFVGVIMFARFRSLDKNKYELYSRTAGNVSCLYENILTTEKKSYYVPVFACHNNTLIGFAEAKNQKDIAELTAHLEQVLKAAGHKCLVKIFDNEAAFLDRVGTMNEKLSDEDLYSTEAIFTTIKAVSL